MKARTKLAAIVVGALSVTALPATAHAGLWCEQADTVDQSISGPQSAGGACRTAIGVVCTVAGKLSGNGGSGCLQ